MFLQDVEVKFCAFFSLQRLSTTTHLRSYQGVGIGFVNTGYTVLSEQPKKLFLKPDDHCTLILLFDIFSMLSVFSCPPAVSNGLFLVIYAGDKLQYSEHGKVRVRGSVRV